MPPTEVYVCQIGYNPPALDGNPDDRTVQITVWDSRESAFAYVVKDCRDSWEGMMDGEGAVPDDDAEVIEEYYAVNADNFYRIDAVMVSTPTTAEPQRVDSGKSTNEQFKAHVRNL
jgi:hypothetical protein